MLFLPAECESFRPFDTVVTCETLKLSNSAMNIKPKAVLATPAVPVHETELHALPFT